MDPNSRLIYIENKKFDRRSESITVPNIFDLRQWVRLAHNENFTNKYWIKF